MAKKTNISTSFTRKVILSFALATVTAVAFATLGKPGLNKERPRKSLLSVKQATRPGTFSLQSGYSFRGSQVISDENRYISVNTVMTYQQGNITYNLPMRKKVALNGKLVFNPNAASRASR